MRHNASSTYITNSLNSSVPGKWPRWDHPRGSAQAPLGGAGRGLSVELSDDPPAFDLLIDDLFSMAWHTSAGLSSPSPPASIILRLARGAGSHYLDDSGGFLEGLGPGGLQRPSIRAGSHTRHPILYASCDDRRKTLRRRPHLSDGVSRAPGITPGRLHQHHGHSLTRAALCT